MSNFSYYLLICPCYIFNACHILKSYSRNKRPSHFNLHKTIYSYWTARILIIVLLSSVLDIKPKNMFRSKAVVIKTLKSTPETEISHSLWVIIAASSFNLLIYYVIFLLFYVIYTYYIYFIVNTFKFYLFATSQIDKICKRFDC